VTLLPLAASCKPEAMRCHTLSCYPRGCRSLTLGDGSTASSLLRHYASVSLLCAKNAGIAVTSLHQSKRFYTPLLPYARIDQEEHPCLRRQAIAVYVCHRSTVDLCIQVQQARQLQLVWLAY
jgi:hypothetical protein